MTEAAQYRREIDGLRAIAVVSVVLNHFYGTIVPSGYLGVDIFFVISGYVISRSLMGRRPERLKELLLGFYARRFQRLLPALILCVALTAVFLSLFAANPSKSLKTGASALFGLSNVYLLKQASDYFGELSQLNAFTHTWSLGVEEQFYLVFPFILWFAVRDSSGRRLGVFRAALMALILLSLVLFLWGSASTPIASFYLMPFRFWELAIGCLIAVNHTMRQRIQPTSSGWDQNAILILILVTLFLPRTFAPATYVAIVALTAAALALLSPGSVAYRAMTSRPMIYLGLVSYSLYLWHWPILVLSRYTIGVSWWTLPFQITLVMGSAHLSYYNIERPLRLRPWNQTHSQVILIGAAATCIAAFFVLILAVPLNGRLYLGTPAKLEARNVESLSYSYRMPQTLYEWAGKPCVLSENAEVGRNLSIDSCTMGRFDQASRRVMIFGNSFSAAFVRGFDVLVKTDHYAVTITSSWGASPIGEIPNETEWSEINDYYWSTVFPRMVSQLRPGDEVVLMSDLAELAPIRADSKVERNRKLFEVGLRKLSAKLSQTGIHLTVLDVNPFIRDSGCQPDAAVPQWFVLGAPPCKFFTKAETVARRQPVTAILRKLERERRLAVIDLLDPLCPRQTCTFLGANNQVLYRDEFSHPSVEAVHTVAPLLRHLLTSRSWPLKQQEPPSTVHAPK